MNLSPIETQYNGYRFRSRLEARWAVFFDTLGVEYEYEPEGFELPNGMRYLPDFKVKCYGTRGGCSPEKYFDLWIEIKGVMTDRDAEKIKAFVWGTGSEIENPLLILSQIPSKDWTNGAWFDFDTFHCYEKLSGIENMFPFNYCFIDGDYFGAFPAAHNGKFYLWGDEGNYIDPEDTEIIRIAYDRARKAQFEFNE